MNQLNTQQLLPRRLPTMEDLYQIIQDQEAKLEQSQQENRVLRQQMEQDRADAEKYRTEIEPLKLLDSPTNQVTIRYRSQQDQKRLDTLRIRIHTHQPPLLPNAYQAWYRYRSSSPPKKTRDPVAIFLEALLELLDENPELVAEIVNTERYRRHFRDITFIEAAAAAAAEEKYNEMDTSSPL